MNDNKSRIHALLAALVFLTFVLAPSIFIRIAAAAEPLAFGGTQPSDAFENEDYSWKLPMTGGTMPYSCNVTSALPLGLLFDSANCAISGKLEKGVASDRKSFGIKASDNSNPRLSVSSNVTIALRYRSNISVSSTLSEGETNIFVDGQQKARSKGGQKTSLVFPSGTKHTITVDPLVMVPNKDTIRFRSVMEKAVIDGNSPDASFGFEPEYNVRIKSNVPDVPTLSGSGWYRPDAVLEVAGLNLVEPKSGIQYRFSHWLLPTGEASGNPALSWKVSKQGDLVANYDTYYQLAGNSEHCTVEGSGWYKAGTRAVWTVECSESIPAPDFWGSLGVELKPEKVTGSVIMDAPREIMVSWKPDYTKIIVQVTFGVIGGLMFILVGFFQERIRRLVSRIRNR